RPPLLRERSRCEYPVRRTVCRPAGVGRSQNSPGVRPVSCWRRRGLRRPEPAAQGCGVPHCGCGGRGMILGITGGTGCGKTTLLRCIAQAGGVILDCDEIYHDLLRTDPELLRAIEERFPGTVKNGVLLRKVL